MKEKNAKLNVVKFWPDLTFSFAALSFSSLELGPPESPAMALVETLSILLGGVVSWGELEDVEVEGHEKNLMN